MSFENDLVKISAQLSQRAEQVEELRRQYTNLVTGRLERRIRLKQEQDAREKDRRGWTELPLGEW